MSHNYGFAINEFAFKMGWTHHEAECYWGGCSPELMSSLHDRVIARGYTGDSDDHDGFAQFLYDEQILSAVSAEALGMTGYVPMTYLCIWGSGYVCSEPRNAFMGEKTREELLADDSFADYHDQIKNLSLGESFNCIGTCDIMTVVRIK